MPGFLGEERINTCLQIVCARLKGRVIISPHWCSWALLTPGAWHTQLSSPGTRSDVRHLPAVPLQGRAPIPAHTLPQWDASQRGFWQAAAVKLCQDWKCTAQTRHEHGENEKHYLQNTLLLPTSIPRLFLSSRFDFFLQTPSANKTSRDGSWDKTRLQALQKLSTFITLLRRTPSGKQRALMLSDKNQRAWDVQAPC